jgi:hypothetical protein
MVALILFILEHPSSNQETKHLAKRLQLEVESKLWPEEIKVAQQAAHSKNLDEYVRQVLEVLNTFSLSAVDCNR